jgi:hypothetical protein
MVPSQIGSLQQLSFLLGVDACLALERRDPERAIELIESAMRLTRAFSAQADTSIWMLALSCRSQHVRWLFRTVAERGDVPEEVLVGALHSLRAFPLIAGDHVLEGERLSGLEAIDAFDDIVRGSFWGAVSCGSGRGPDCGRARTRVEEAYGQAIAMRNGSVDEILLAALQNQAPDWSNTKELPFVEYTTYVMDAILIGDIRSRSASGGLEIAISIALHAARHGAPPATLDAIDPDILAHVPSDPFAPDGAYRHNSAPSLASVVVYSVEVDRTDDGGLLARPQPGPIGTGPIGAGDQVFTQDPCASSEQ